MKRLHWPRFAVFVTIIATLVIMTAAANGAASATAPQTTDELNSAMVQSWAFAQNDGDNACNQTTAIIDATSTLVLQTADYAFLMGAITHNPTNSSRTRHSGAFEGRTCDAGGVYFAAVTCDGTVRYEANREDAKKMAARMSAEKKFDKKSTRTTEQIVKTANTNGVVIRA